MNQQQLIHLALALIGQDSLTALHEISKLAAASHCNVKESRLATLGSEFGLLLLLTGSWDAIAKFEAALPPLQKRMEWQCVVKRTKPTEYSAQLLPYTVQVVAMDNIGLVQQITGFFTGQGIQIHEMYTTTYHASHSGTPMFSLTMAVNIPGNMQISELRERFILFCDELNLDAIIEPEKS